MTRQTCKVGIAGATGYVGGTIRAQGWNDQCFDSKTIDQVKNYHFDTFVCAAAPGQKWLANQDPDKDKASIENLINNLSNVSCDTFVLLSTVDVFQQPNGVNEDSKVDENGLNPYGLHRRNLEKFVQTEFKRHLVVRLPGLVGPGLRKNVVFDFLNDNNIDRIDSRGIFQFYPMVNLRYDIEIALNAGLELVHLTAEPVSVSDVALLCFNKQFEQAILESPPVYDFQSKHAGIFCNADRYQYDRRESIMAIRAYAQSEPRSLPK